MSDESGVLLRELDRLNERMNELESVVIDLQETIIALIEPTDPEIESEEEE